MPALLSLSGPSVIERWETANPDVRITIGQTFNQNGRPDAAERLVEVLMAAARTAAATTA